VEDSLRIGELMRLAVMSQAKRVFGERCTPLVFSSQDIPEHNRHGHSFYLPADSDGDGHIDHIVIHADGGLSGPPLRALDRTASTASGQAAAPSGRCCWSNMAPPRKLKVPDISEPHVSGNQPRRICTSGSEKKVHG